MILETLYQFALLHDLIPGILKPRSVGCTLHLDEKGKLRTISVERSTVFADPPEKRSSNIQPRLLDNAVYTFGFDPKKHHGEAKQASFLENLRRFSKEVPALSAIERFVRRPLSSDLQKTLIKIKTADIAFTVDGVSPYDHTAVVSLLKEENPTAVCRVTGRPCTPGFVPSLRNIPPNGSSLNLIGYNATASRFDDRENVDCFPLHREVREGVVRAIDHIARFENGRRSTSVISTRALRTKKATAAERGRPHPITLFFTLERKDFDLEPLMVLLRGTPQEKEFSGEYRKACYQQALGKLKEWEDLEGDLYLLTLKADEAKRRAAILDWTVLSLKDLYPRLQRYTEVAGPVPMRWRLNEMPSHTESWRFMRSVLAGEPVPPTILRKIVLNPSTSTHLFGVLSAYTP